MTVGTLTRDSMSDSIPDQPADVTSPEGVAPDAGATTERRGLFRRRKPAKDPSATPADDAAGGTADAIQAEIANGSDTEAADERAGVRPGVLRRRRRKLLGQYEQGIFDLGGLAMELRARGLLAEEVMRRRAAEVADLRGQVDHLDDRLTEIRSERSERRQSGRGSGVICPSCGARGRAKANFCAQCGAALAFPETPADATADQPTMVITHGSDQATQVISATAVGNTEVIPTAKVDE